jgi:hypothetical protein
MTARAKLAGIRRQNIFDNNVSELALFDLVKKLYGGFRVGTRLFFTIFRPGDVQSAQKIGQ